MRLILILVLTFSSISVFAKICPLGAKEDTLTLARVMRNFGKAVRDADGLAVETKQWPEEGTTEKLLAASQPISMGIVCADELINNPTGDLLPKKLNELQGEMREQYLKHYIDALKKFRDGLVEYKRILEDLAALPADQRKFEGLYIHYKYMDDMVNTFHDHLGGG